MSDSEEGSTVEEQPGSPEEEQPGSPEEEQEDDLKTEENGDHADESETADHEEGSRKRSLSTSEEKNDDSPSKKVAKEEISLAIICDSRAKNLEKIVQTETAIIFHLKVKVTEDFSIESLPEAVEEVLSEDPETKCVVIVLPQNDLVQSTIPLSCKMNGCSGRGVEHTLPMPVSSISTYMDKLKSTREELLDTYPDTEFYWLTPGPIDFRNLNRKVPETKHGHPTTSEPMWTTMVANYIKRLKVIYEEIPGKMAVTWFSRACWLNNRGKYNQGTQASLHQRLLQGDLGPAHAAQLLQGDVLTVKGCQAMWMTIRKKIHWYRKLQAVEKAKAENEKDEDATSKKDDDQKDGEEVNGKADEDTNAENDSDGQKKKNIVKTTVIGDSWIQILSEIDRWQTDYKKRKNIKIYPDLMLESIPEIIDQVLSGDTDTENLVLSVFQNTIISCLATENVENEIFPCAYTTVDEIMEKTSEIAKYVKKTYPKVKLFWVAPGPVGYFNENKKEEKMETEEQKEETKKEETEGKKNKKEKANKKDEDKDDDDDKEDDEDDDEKDEDDEDEDKDEEEKDDDKDEDKAEEDKAENEENDKSAAQIEEEEKEEDPEVRKLRRACSSSNTIALILSRRLLARFNKQVVNWFEVFDNDYGTKNVVDNEGKILEGKLVNPRYLDDDFMSLSECGGNKLSSIINKACGLDKYNRNNRTSNDHGSQGINRRLGGRMDGGRGRGGRGGGRGRGGGGRKDGGVGGNRPIDKRLSWDGRGGGQREPWGQQGGGNRKWQQQRSYGADMRDVINRERTNNYQRGGGNWGGRPQYVDPWARNDYGGYYGQRY